MPYPPPRLTAFPSALTVPLLSGFVKKCLTIPVPCFELASARGMWPTTSSLITAIALRSRFILSCFATYSSLSNRTKVLYAVPHHNFLSSRGGAHSTRPPWLACAPDQNRHAAQVTSSSSFVIACSAGRDSHGSIRHGIVTRNK